MKLEITAKEAALLYAIFEVPAPPIVEGELRSLSWVRRRKQLAEIEKSLLARGVIVAGESGGPELSESTSGILAHYFGADIQMTLEDDQGPSSTVFLGNGEAGVMIRRGEMVELYAPTQYNGAELAQRILGLDTKEDDFPARRVEMTTQQLESVMHASVNSDKRQLDAICTAAHWDISFVTEVASNLGKTAPFYKLTAVRPGQPGLAVLRFNPTKDGFWAFKFVFMGARDSAEMGWYPYTRLIETATDFAGA